MSDHWWEPDAPIPCGCTKCACREYADIVSPRGTAFCGCCLADCPDRHPA